MPGGAACVIRRDRFCLNIDGASSIMNIYIEGQIGNGKRLSLKMIMTEHVAAGVAYGLLYDKSNKNLWSSILLHSLSNAAIMALGVGVL